MKPWDRPLGPWVATFSVKEGPHAVIWRHHRHKWLQIVGLRTPVTGQPNPIFPPVFAGLGLGDNATTLGHSAGVGRFSLLMARRIASSGHVALSHNGQPLLVNGQQAPTGPLGQGTLVVGCSGDGPRQGPQLVGELSVLLLVPQDVGDGLASALAAALQASTGRRGSMRDHLAPWFIRQPVAAASAIWQALSSFLAPYPCL